MSASASASTLTRCRHQHASRGVHSPCACDVMIALSCSSLWHNEHGCKQALEGTAAEAIVKGDAKCTAIAAASIVAKVRSS